MHSRDWVDREKEISLLVLCRQIVQCSEATSFYNSFRERGLSKLPRKANAKEEVLDGMLGVDWLKTQGRHSLFVPGSRLSMLISSSHS